jgi:hypothetical protein
MVLIANIHPNNIWQSFALGALLQAIIVVLAINIESLLNKESTTLKSAFITFIVTFVATMLAYGSVYILFGYRRE